MHISNESPPKKGILVLSFVQMFSTLSYAVLWSTLIFYLTNGLKIHDKLAADITAEFIALSFSLYLLGGIVGGRFFSFRSLFVIAMLLQLTGLLLLSIPNPKLMYWALAIYLSGSGFNVTCINCMLTQLFSPEDKRREKAFLWNYSAMNTGYFIGFLAGGYFLLNGNFRLLFILSALANIIALVSIFIGWTIFKDDSKQLPYSKQLDFQLDAESRAIRNVQLVHEHWIKTKIFLIQYFPWIIPLAFLIIVLTYLLKNPQLGNLLIISGVFVAMIFIGYLAYQQKEKEASNKIWAYLILFITAFCFYSISQFAPIGLNLFINRNVDLHVGGFILAPQWLQNLNPIITIICGPLLANLYHKLRLKGYNISIPLQFGISLIIMGLSLVALTIGIYFSNTKGLSDVSWAMISILLQGLAEVLFSPIGFAMIGQLAPRDYRSLFMGNWLTCIGIGAILAGYFSKLALGSLNVTNPLITNASYSHSFSILGWGTIMIGLIFLSLKSYLNRLTNEK